MCLEISRDIKRYQEILSPQEWVSVHFWAPHGGLFGSLLSWRDAFDAFLSSLASLASLSVLTALLMSGRSGQTEPHCSTAASTLKDMALRHCLSMSFLLKVYTTDCELPPVLLFLGTVSSNNFMPRLVTNDVIFSASLNRARSAMGSGNSWWWLKDPKTADVAGYNRTLYKFPIFPNTDS